MFCRLTHPSEWDTLNFFWFVKYSPYKTTKLLVGWVLWHINLCRSFNAKSSLEQSCEFLCFFFFTWKATILLPCTSFNSLLWHFIWLCLRLFWLLQEVLHTWCCFVFTAIQIILCLSVSYIWTFLVKERK